MQSDSNIEMSLREHLLAAQAGQQVPATPETKTFVPQSGSPHIDPAIAGTSPYTPMSGESSAGDADASRKGRRELSTSKRAAQNRAAQRAFRQRKEEFIKNLKDEVAEYKAIAETFKTIQQENHLLRDYVSTLQSRLLESEVGFPDPPPTIDFSNPRPDYFAEARARHAASVASTNASAGATAPAVGGPGRPPAGATSAPHQAHSTSPSQPIDSNAVSQLQAAAAQAAAASAHEEMNSNGKHGAEDSYMEGDYPPSKRAKSTEDGGEGAASSGEGAEDDAAAAADTSAAGDGENEIYGDEDGPRKVE